MAKTNRTRLGTLRNAQRPAELGVDAASLDLLCKLGRTQFDEKGCADFLDMEVKTFEAFLDANPKARRAYEKGQALFRIQLQRCMFESAERDPRMALHWAERNLEHFRTARSVPMQCRPANERFTAHDLEVCMAYARASLADPVERNA
jgi:hypothetical protein